ncbi:MAG TPA: pitrilysin family protein [bacterium]|nr:pitrilysin family protein [bacterium]
MKRNIALFMILLAALFAADAVLADPHIAQLQLPDPDTMTFGPLNFTTVEPSIETLKTGMEFWRIPDQTLPLVTLVMDLDAGTAAEPAGKSGVAEMTAEMLIRGGTEKMTAEEFTRQAELFGFDFNARVDSEFTQVSVTCLARDLTPAAMMLMDLVRKPGFDPAQLELVRDAQVEQLRRMAQSPFFQAFNTLSARLFGADHPRTRVPDEDTLNAVTREDLIAFHGAWYHPSLARFAVIGAADDAACNQLKMLVSGWKGDAVDAPVTPQPQPVTEERTVVIVDRSGTQALVAMGHLGLEANHPDRYTLEVFNEIYGGQGLSSRLMNQVRTQKGLAYVVFGSHILENPRGMFFAACMTKNDSAVEAIQTILDVTEELQTTPVPDEELNRVIESMENSFIFKFEQPRRVLQRMLVYRRMGMPEDYLATYLEKIRAVTPEMIMQAAADHIHPEMLQIVVAGPADVLKPKLETLGWPIEVIESD